MSIKIQCYRCPLSETRKNIVIGKGYGKPIGNYLFLGEAPGESEDILNEPFIGISGKLLREMIKESGLKNYFFTNSILCRPIDKEGKNRQPSEKELECCYDNVMKIIQYMNPKCIVFVGKVSYMFYNNLIRCRKICIDHPSFILRKGGKSSFLYRENLKRLEKLNREFKH